jgi:hypothetical protein
VDAAIANTVADILRVEISGIEANKIESSRGALGASVKQQLLAISNEWALKTPVLTLGQRLKQPPQQPGRWRKASQCQPSVRDRGRLRPNY